MRVEYENLPSGTYTFEVLAVNRDLEYSAQPAQVRLTVHPPYGQLSLGGGLILALVGMATASGYALRKRRAQRQTERAFLREQQARLQAQEQLNQELEKELQTAHELQMSLMPREAPSVRPDTAYRVIEVQLEAGDRVVFCSDGIIEAANWAGEQFGFGRTEAVIRRGCAEDLPATALLARIIEEVKAFSGEVPQGDDQTVVVLKVKNQTAP